MIVATHGILANASITYDIDAQAFFTASGVSNLTQKNAVNQLVLDLKSYGIWTKMKALYPFVGGTATTHKYNLKDPRDLDAAYRLQFVNGWTHSSTGAKPSGTDAYANSYIAPNAMAQNSIHASFYSRTNTSGVYFDIEGENSTSVLGILASYNAGSGNASYLYMNSLSSDNVLNGNQSTGLYIGSRTASNISALFQRGVKIIAGVKSSLSPSNQNIYLGAGNYNGTPGGYSPREQAFASIGDGLTDTECLNFNSAVNTYQAALSRNL